MAERVPMRLLDADIEDVRGRDGVRRIVVDVLVELGILPRGSGSQMRKPRLRVVESDDRDDAR